ncbi:1842_t:CDS:2, partial [Ambispora leptoticha]
MSTSSFSSAENFAPLWNFLRTSSLDKITTSNVITQLWNCFKIQTEQEDFDSIMKILKETESEIIDKEHMGFLRGKFEERVNWKALALNSIELLKDKIKKKGAPPHEHIFTKISNIDVDALSNDDPLCIGVIDLSSDKYNIPESDYESLI